MAEKEKVREQLVIDATGAILGRLSSYIAKQSMLGKKVIVLNCDKVLLSGKRKMIIHEYNIARRRGGTSLNGPHFPKHTDRIVKRTVRGMLAYTQQRGLDALKRVICYTNTPAEYVSVKKMTFESKTKAKTLALDELSKDI